MAKEINFQEISDLDLVNIVNETGGIAWRLNHDAGHGRIPNKGVDDSIKELMETRNKVVSEITRRTGISNNDSLKNYIRGKLGEQNDMWDAQWAEVYNEGAVLAFREDQAVKFEVIRTYLPSHITSGPNQNILIRPWEKKHFVTHIDDRDILKLIRLEKEKPMYSNMSPLERGLIKAHEEPTKRKIKNDDGEKQWHEFYQEHIVFLHKGFNETFETVEHYNFPNVSRCTENELILARSYSRPVLVEFSLEDLPLMELSKEKPRYLNTGKDALNLNN